MRFLTIILAAFSLSGCSTMQIEERNFIRADKAGAVHTESGDLRSSVPAMRLRDVALDAGNGATLRGVIAERAGATTTVLYFGGNAFHLDQQGADLLPLLASCGVNVAVFDYRGYGRSSGAPTVANLAADALLVFDEVSAQAPGRVIVHGQSLGSFMAAHVAAQRPQAAGLVLEATATNVADWADANLPWYARPFLRLEIAESLRAVDNVAAVARFHGAGLVLAGERDHVTPAALGRRVFAAMNPARRQWIEQAGAGHNDIFGSPALMPAYCAFVQQ